MWSEWASARPPHQCLLRELAKESPRTRAQLTSLSPAQLHKLLDSGLTLRLGWPRVWCELIENSLGQRLYLSHAENFSSTVRLATVASSSLGRGRQALKAWPLLLDHALQQIARQGQRLLLVPGTTTCADAEQFARRAGLPSLQAVVDDTMQLDDWIQHAVTRPQTVWRSQLWISPALGTISGWQEFPLQDRLAILLSDVVMALSVRRNGRIAGLLNARLRSEEIPAGSTFCAVLPGQEATAQSSAETIGLMENGAVGWLVWKSPKQQVPGSTPCHRSPPATCQIVAAVPRAWHERAWHVPDDSRWTWLVHCTRGGVGRLPNESLEQYRDRLWLLGSEDVSHPYNTLLRICSSGTLVGSNWTTRTEQPSISFSAVPLLELLSRRTYRSHLGRWDWEPYGVAIRRQALERRGGRAVIYGTEDDYKQLDESDRPFFQPRGSANASRLSKTTANDWASEREWRLLGNLALKQLKPEDCFFFTRTPEEAQQLARIASSTVYWIGNSAYWIGNSAD